MITALIVVASVLGYLAIGAKLIEPHARKKYRQEILADQRDHPALWRHRGSRSLDDVMHDGTWAMVIVGTLFWPVAAFLVPVIMRCKDEDRDFVETIRDADEAKR